MLRKSLIIVLCLMASLVGNAQKAPKKQSATPEKEYFISTSFHEPATDGLRFIYSEDAIHWKAMPDIFLEPRVGKQKVLRDPSIIRTPDGIFRLVWTSSWRGDRGFGYAQSKDLMHWTDVKFVTVMSDTTTVNVWAPELFWDDTRNQAMIVWASCVPGKFPDGLEEHNNNQRLYYSTTKDFKTFTPGKLLIDPGFSCIDATILKRGTKVYVMILKDNTRPERDIKVSFAADPEGPWSAASAPFTDKFCEGPTVVELRSEDIKTFTGNGKGDNSDIVAPRGWLVYYDAYRLKRFGAAFTEDFIHFKDVSDKVDVPEGHKHGTMFKVPEHILKLMLEPERVHYSGTTQADPSCHDGRLSPVVGVHNIQILRANREHPTSANGNGWTYNHQPMMAYWNGKFYVHYLSDPAEEHVPPSHTMMQTSVDGYHWTDPVELFPTYDVPEGFTKPNYKAHPELQYPDAYKQHPLKAIMHQRVGWYVSKGGILLAMGNYGVALDRKDDPNDGNGIGRVVREVKEDGTFGPIYFIYYNHGFSEKNTAYPNYRHAPKAVRKACEEILANPRYRMQWVEEADRNDPLIPIPNGYKAYNDYTLPDGNLVALWKHALTSTSRDGGLSWSLTERAPGFVNSNAKIWGQRLTDGTYATVYNPSEYRWPLGISLSSDGLDYKTLNLVCGEVPPMRYGGNFKSRGPQYVRGIQEGNGTPNDSDLWVSYSMNKEDIWVAHIPVPVRTEATAQANDDFSKCKSLEDLRTWNLYSPKMAPVSLDGKWLKLSDEDPFDYAVAERKVPASGLLNVQFDVNPAQNRNGLLQIEFKDEKGTACTRIEFTHDGFIRVKNGARYGNVMSYEPDKTYHFDATLDAANRKLTLYVNGKRTERIFFAPVHKIERIMFRTGAKRTFPTIDTPADWYGILPNTGDTDTLAVYRIANFKTQNLADDAGAAVLSSADYKHYVDYFNSMEDENIVQAIPNKDSWEWMKSNIPLFDCPDKQFEQTYYYRWWTLRKHIEKTPVGYAMTEFLVPRSYADKYNLISSALGHHIMESRWIRNPKYLDGIIHTWYYGNDGNPMRKINFYSQWTPYSILQRYAVDGNKESLIALLPRMKWQYNEWDNHRWKTPNGNGLYWQYDVRDAMEETISGGRREKNARPSINSYMFGNAVAISVAAHFANDDATATEFFHKADTLKSLINNNLWDKKAGFFEVHKPVFDANGVTIADSSANVREEIGFLPWYFGAADDTKTESEAWLQLTSDKGFRAPYGITTAERSNPKFRSHGVGKCEWDGAVWPFATSQTLTAMANWLSDYKVHPLDIANNKSTNATENADFIENYWHRVYFENMQKYVESQCHRGRPYIGEYLDETTGAWLMGDRERSRYYNHSTFNDLIITGLCGLRPQLNNELVVNPLLPAGQWDYFCLDNVLYHGHNITIVWDKDGSRYHIGKGLSLLVDGTKKAHRNDLGRITCTL